MRKACMLEFSLATENEIKSELVSRLKSQRLHLKLTQDELGVRANVGINTVRRFEASGQTTLANFLNLVMALGLVEELQSLFILKMTSIAQMEKAEISPRQRASRKKPLPARRELDVK